jgi:hypothetical protein
MGQWRCGSRIGTLCKALDRDLDYLERILWTEKRAIQNKLSHQKIYSNSGRACLHQTSYIFTSLLQDGFYRHPLIQR